MTTMKMMKASEKEYIIVVLRFRSLCAARFLYIIARIEAPFHHSSKWPTRCSALCRGVGGTLSSSTSDGRAADSMTLY